jgi:hypothetical protein
MTAEVSERGLALPTILMSAAGANFFDHRQKRTQ